MSAPTDAGRPVVSEAEIDMARAIFVIPLDEPVSRPSILAARRAIAHAAVRLSPACDAAAIERLRRDLATEVDAAEVQRARFQRLLIAFHDATRRPLGVTPYSGDEFYDWRMAESAEERRPRYGTEDERRERPEVRLVAAQREKAAALGLLDGHALVVRQIERGKAAAEAGLSEARVENNRLRQGRNRFKSGVRSAVTWLHGRAREMDDPKARDILNSAVADLGVDLAADAVPVSSHPPFVQVRHPLLCDWHKFDTATGRHVETKEGDPFPGVPVRSDVPGVLKGNRGGKHDQ